MTSTELSHHYVIASPKMPRAARPFLDQHSQISNTLAEFFRSRNFSKKAWNPSLRDTNPICLLLTLGRLPYHELALCWLCKGLTAPLSTWVWQHSSAPLATATIPKTLLIPDFSFFNGTRPPVWRQFVSSGYVPAWGGYFIHMGSLLCLIAGLRPHCCPAQGREKKKSKNHTNQESIR